MTPTARSSNVPGPLLFSTGRAKSALAVSALVLLGPLVAGCTDDPEVVEPTPTPTVVETPEPTDPTASPTASPDAEDEGAGESTELFVDDKVPVNGPVLEEALPAAVTATHVMVARFAWNERDTAVRKNRRNRWATTCTSYEGVVWMSVRRDRTLERVLVRFGRVDDPSSTDCSTGELAILDGETRAVVEGLDFAQLL